MFTDAEFITAREKELVLKDWERFLKGDFKQTLFTKRLYEHLHLHCGYIAHYNQHGFYAEYFESGPDTIRFFEAFGQNTQRFGSHPDYQDLQAAMREVFENYRHKIEQLVQDDVAARLTLLETCLHQAKQDPKFARDFLQKLSF